MNFFKRRRHYRIVNLFCIADEAQAKSFDINECADYCFEFLKRIKGDYPGFYSINYSNQTWRSRKAFSKAISGNPDIVFVSSNYEKSNCYLTISNTMLNFQQMPKLGPIELTLAVEDDAMGENDILTFCQGLGLFYQYHYGYVIKSSEAFDFSREEKHTSTFFSKQQNMQQENEAWRDHISALKFGFVRKIYPINVLRRAHLDNLNLDPGGLSLVRINDDMVMWILKEEEVEMYRDQLSNSPYVLANVKFIEDPLWREFFFDVHP